MCRQPSQAPALPDQAAFRRPAVPSSFPPPPIGARTATSCSSTRCARWQTPTMTCITAPSTAKVSGFGGAGVRACCAGVGRQQQQQLPAATVMRCCQALAAACSSLPAGRSSRPGLVTGDGGRRTGAVRAARSSALHLRLQQPRRAAGAEQELLLPPPQASWPRSCTTSAPAPATSSGTTARRRA
jgi:hypothetical protein